MPASLVEHPASARKAAPKAKPNNRGKLLVTTELTGFRNFIDNFLLIYILDSEAIYSNQLPEHSVGGPSLRSRKPDAYLVRKPRSSRRFVATLFFNAISDLSASNNLLRGFARHLRLASAALPLAFAGGLLERSRPCRFDGIQAKGQPRYDVSCPFQPSCVSNQRIKPDGWQRLLLPPVCSLRRRTALTAQQTGHRP